MQHHNFLQFTTGTDFKAMCDAQFHKIMCMMPPNIEAQDVEYSVRFRMLAPILKAVRLRLLRIAVLSEFDAFNASE